MINNNATVNFLFLKIQLFCLAFLTKIEHMIGSHYKVTHQQV